MRPKPLSGAAEPGGSAAPSDLGLEAARQTILGARGIVILTGAGVSAESGIPTFRDAQGLWSRFRPEELATPEGFRKDPRRVWEWYELRRRAVLACDPNPGHTAIAEFMLSRNDVTLVTQNVDGLHQRALDEAQDWAGSGLPRSADPSGRILELHGNLLRTRCSECEGAEPSGRRMGADPVGLNTLPRCHCGALMRPDVVWFGEALDHTVLDAAFEAARGAEVCISAGTSTVVHPAASVPLATLEVGGAIIEVNPEETPISALSECVLRGVSTQVIPLILAT